MNFAPDHRKAASELARVTRAGGRLGLTVMPLDSRAGALWTLVREYRSRGDHPGAWTAELLEPWFDVETQQRESQPDERFTPKQRWEFMREHAGFVREVADEPGFRERFLQLAAEHEDRPLRSTVIIGTRR